jgi:ribosome-associated protein
MLEITPSIMIDESEIQFNFVRSSGPGGQNVNKVATACQLRFDVQNTQSLPGDVKERLIRLAGSRMTDDGILIIEAKRYRTQEQNRLDALLRLKTLIVKTLDVPKIRKPTRPSLRAKATRVHDKKLRGETKATRRKNPKELD